MTITKRVTTLEEKMKRIENLLWYVAGVSTVKLGGDYGPEVIGFFI